MKLNSPIPKIGLSCSEEIADISDERILGDGEFVEKTLLRANEAFEKKYRLEVKGTTVDRIAERVAERVAEIMGIEPNQVWAPGKQHKVVRARSLLCYWATWGSARYGWVRS